MLPYRLHHTPDVEEIHDYIMQPAIEVAKHFYIGGIKSFDFRNQMLIEGCAPIEGR